MTIDSISQWFLIFVPLAISPGPANILFAASGATFGVKSSIPFWLGTNLICIFQSLLIGLSLESIISAYSEASVIIKYIGVAFLIYLAIRFFKYSVKEKENVKKLTFRDGVIVELLNAKYLIIPTIMFSQFYISGNEKWSQIIYLTMALGMLTMVSNLAWIVAGKGLTKYLVKAKTQKIQGLLFGSMLSVTALWLAIG